jgi:prepilin-type N-terminal cleavage/methylation domain-containing protein
MRFRVGARNDRRKDNKKAAFTLAEVLITLAIVGIVAALTIPSLINKCQKIVWAKRAQKEYALLTQAFKRILADNNTTSLSETELWNKFSVDINYYSNGPGWKAFFTEFGKYIKLSLPETFVYEISYINEGHTSSNSNRYYAIYLSDGAEILGYTFKKTPYKQTDEVCTKIKSFGGSMCNSIGYFSIDVNGAKGPNTYGRDIFDFKLSDEGILYPHGGKDYSLFLLQTDLDSNYWYWKNTYNHGDADKRDGNYRTGQLMEEGWKMNY